jgi:cytochrome bd-type quinol oxidase subunit 2
MNRELSRRLFIAEAVLLGLPLTGLLGLVVSGMSISNRRAFWPFGAIDLVPVFAAFAVFGGWWLLVKAIRGGAEALQKTNRMWWLAASIGGLLVLAAIVSRCVPASPDYSSAALFRECLEDCMFGLPLVVVLAHLWAEARFQKPANNAMPATCENARDGRR